LIATDFGLKTMMPLWKIKRELSRLKQQLLSMPAFFLEANKQKAYDATFDQHIQLFHGSTIQTQAYAILLCYQPKGLSASTFFTCQHLQSQGYKVLLVSNAPMSGVELERVRPYVWRVVIRPNFGYDFGGYRDGVRLLKQWGEQPQRLLVLNDSMWYPLYEQDQLLRKVASSGAAFIGAMQLNKISRPDKIFYESYFYGFSGDFFASPQFTDYWAHYKLSDIKFRAVKAGERGLSKAMLKWQIAHEPIFHREKLLVAAEQQPASFLLKTLQYAAYIDPAFENHGRQLISSYTQSDAWRIQALAHMRKVATRRHFHASFCYASIRLLGIPFLKKSATPLHIAMRRQYVAAVLAGDLAMPTSSEMFEEIRQRDAHA
jgi:hypothetical protein